MDVEKRPHIIFGSWDDIPVFKFFIWAERCGVKWHINPWRKVRPIDTYKEEWLAAREREIHVHVCGDDGHNHDNTCRRTSTKHYMRRYPIK